MNRISNIFILISALLSCLFSSIGLAYSTSKLSLVTSSSDYRSIMVEFAAIFTATVASFLVCSYNFQTISNKIATKRIRILRMGFVIYLSFIVRFNFLGILSVFFSSTNADHNIGIILFSSLLSLFISASPFVNLFTSNMPESQ